MEQLQFEIMINAEPEKVWSVLWDDISYRQWTTALNEGSFYQGTWEEGSIMKFFDSHNNGMYSQVEKNTPAQEMKLRHLGEIFEGVETPTDWGAATEDYLLEENEEGTVLKIKISTKEEFRSFFEEHYPNALRIIKNLSENQL